MAPGPAPARLDGDRTVERHRGRRGAWRPRGVGVPRTPEPTTFVVLAFGISWALWGIAALATGGPVAPLAQIAGSFGPSLAAVAVLARAGGWPPVRDGLVRLVRLRGAGCATAVAAGVPAALAGIALIVDQLLGGSTPIQWPPWWAAPVAAAYVLVLGGPLGEELGWRGSLLPRLQVSLGPVLATLVTGAVWTAWHLPLFLIAGTVQTRVPLWMFAIQVVATSFLYTWLLHLAPHSLAPALAFHTSFNVSVGLLLLQPAVAPATRPLLLALLAAALLAVVLVRTPTFRNGASHDAPSMVGHDCHPSAIPMPIRRSR